MYVYFNNNPKLTADYKILDASRLCREKYGVAGRICYVHPDTFAEVIGDGEPGDGYKLVHDIRVEPDKKVMPNNFAVSGDVPLEKELE